MALLFRLFVNRSLIDGTTTLSGRCFSGEAVAVGVNTRKSGTDPELKPVSEYPPWVAELATPQETMFDLRKKMASLGQESLKFQEAERMVKLESRHGIRNLNVSKAKK